MKDSNPYDVTQDQQGKPLPQGDAAQVELPQRIGRYRIEKVLGKGGFGLVYLAHDEQLDRLVAIKVPHATLISQPEDAEAYLAEARTVAYVSNSESRLQPVGSKLPNRFGTFDMHGNAYEFCHEEGRLRGGAFRNVPGNVQSAHRNYDRPYYRYCIGFRLARTYKKD